jgi:3-oxoacyl-[acyl-carrier protein] reductase
MNDVQRVAFVTGGSRGIGLACARHLAATGHRVAIGSRSKPDEIDDGMLWVEIDVTDQTSVDSAFSAIEDQLGPVHVLVANAGITRDMLALRMTDGDFEAVIDANLTGAFRVAKRSLKAMMKARWGRIIFMSSVVGALGQAGQVNYAASKAGLAGLGRSLAREFASRGITVNLVAPGPIETDMLAEVKPDTVQAMEAQVPLGRLGQVDDVAAAVTFLASESAGYITGATIPVDGGLGMGA